MDSSESGSEEEEFFGAVSNDCRVVVVAKSKNRVKKRISRGRIAKNSIAIFKCRPNGEGGILKELLHHPRFRITDNHWAALDKPGFKFLAQR